MAYGDHIKVRAKILLGIPWHHGIDLGDGTVIHFTGDRKDEKSAKIIRTTLQEFLCGEALVIVNHKDCLEPSEVVRRAIWRLGDQGYGLIFNNCEHFANWCKIGERKSNQFFGLGSLFSMDPGDSILNYDIYLGEGR
jgi:hypothetical protein